MLTSKVRPSAILVLSCLVMGIQTLTEWSPWVTELMSWGQRFRASPTPIPAKAHYLVYG